MKKPGGLGRGLQALLSQKITPTENNQLQAKELKFIDEKIVKTLKTKPIATKELTANAVVKDAIPTLNDTKLITLSITQLQPGKYQPRITIEPEALSALADSIKQQGLLQPLVVREIGKEYYEIIAGERRWRACKLAGLTEVPVILVNVNDEKAMIMALIENLQREDLNVMEEAHAMDRLIKEFNLTHQEVAKLLSKSRASVTNCLRLLNLHQDVRFLLETGEIDMGHARALLILNAQEQSQIAQQIVAKGLTVRETETLVTRMKDGVDKNIKIKTDDTFTVYQEQIAKLSSDLAMAISLKSHKNGKGKIIIHYDDALMLEKMLKRLAI